MPGDASTVQKTAERRAILEAIRDALEPIGPKDIAETTGLKSANVRQILARMVKDETVQKVERGRYKCDAVMQ